jgi:arginase
MAGLRLIAWPYHAGLRDVSMGLGPTVLAADAELLDALGSPPVEVVPPVDESQPEVARIFELDRRLAQTVRGARSAGDFPIVLAGNCASSIGTVAGAGAGCGVVWFDAHADFDTPEDNLSGFTDVMALAILTGSGWRALRETVPGFAVVDERDVVLAAVRDLEPYQRERVERSRLRAVPGAFDPAALAAQLDGLRESTERVYLHVDLDALDRGVARVNAYSAPGGPSLDALLAAIDAVFDRFEVVAAALTAWDPRLDDDGAAARAARAVAIRIGARGRAGSRASASRAG